MFDASAKLPPSGLLQGTLHFPGNFDSCLEVVAPEFTGKHCLLTFFEFEISMWGRSLKDMREMSPNPMKFQNPLTRKFPTHELRKLTGLKDEEEEQDPLALFKSGMLRLGRCVPSVCDDEDISIGFHNFLSDQNILGMTAANITAWPLNCHTADETVQLDGGDWTMILIIGVFAILILTGTVIDAALNIFHLDIFPQTLVQVFQGFSLYQNTLKLFNTDGGSSDSLDCINGIRFLSMTWVLVGHAYSTFMGQIFVNNMNVLGGEAFLGNGAYAAVLNALPSVDSFFLIGSTLLAYITLKELDKTNGGGVKFWIMYYVHRYIRLSGVYAMVIGFHATLLKFFAFAPQSNVTTFAVDGCKKNWWMNLLYVNNLHWIAGDEGLSCMGQTWYMAVDMQFFIFTPLIIWTLWRHEKVGLILSAILTVGATAVPLALAWQNDYPFSPTLNEGRAGQEAYMGDFYIVPWCRFQPYIVGIVLGFVLHKMRKQPKLKINAVALTWIWSIAFAVGALVIYGLVPYQLEMGAGSSTAERSFYNGFHRLAWALCLSWVILACVKGAGGPVNSLLSWKAWVPLARMSYCIYLVHMTVLSYYGSLASYTVSISQPVCIYFILFILGICIAISYVCVCVFEAPFVHLEKLLYVSLGITKLPAVRHVKRE